MATRTQNRTSNRSSKRGTASRPSTGKPSERAGSSREDSAFSWGNGSGALVGATLAGVAIGFAANYGRKFLMQGMEAMAGEWDEILAACRTHL